MNLSPLSIVRIITLLSFGAVSVATTSILAPAIFTLPEPRPGCDVPIRWKLGDVDPEFPLDRKAFLSAVFQAETVWEREIGRDLFLYDPDSAFVVTTVFDERQMMTYDNQELENRISRYEDSIDSLSTRYETLKAAYERDTVILKKRVSGFNLDLHDYNRAVMKANADGGADSDLYEELEKTKDSLEDDQSDIRKESDRLELVADELNGLADRINAETRDVNRHIRNFRETYGDPRPFVQGLYDPDNGSITIFQFERQEDLRLVLAHEFGHALGIDEHVKDDPTALMYSLMDGQDIVTPSLTDNDIRAYEKVCSEHIPSPRERFIRYLVETPGNRITMRGILESISLPTN